MGSVSGRHVASPCCAFTLQGARRKRPLQPVSSAHTLAHGIRKVEGNVWYDGGFPNLSTSMLSLSQCFLPRYVRHGARPRETWAARPRPTPQNGRSSPAGVCRSSRGSGCGTGPGRRAPQRPPTATTRQQALPPPRSACRPPPPPTHTPAPCTGLLLRGVMVVGGWVQGGRGGSSPPPPPPPNAAERRRRNFSV